MYFDRDFDHVELLHSTSISLGWTLIFKKIYKWIKILKKN